MLRPQRRDELLGEVREAIDTHGGSMTTVRARLAAREGKGGRVNGAQQLRPEVILEQLTGRLNGHVIAGDEIDTSYSALERLADRVADDMDATKRTRPALLQPRRLHRGVRYGPPPRIGRPAASPPPG